MGFVQNATVGSEVIMVEAMDSDVGENARVEYRLKEDLSGDFRTFSIGPSTGLVTLTKPLDRESQKLYQVITQTIL